MSKKKLVVLTGAGISAESGIPTFRGVDGLWEGHRVEEVASPEGWRANPEMVLEFYNMRRKVAHEAKPNLGHKILAKLENHFDVTVITQNIDNLHEQGGSSNVMHLHGELFKSRSTKDENLVYDIDGWELKLGDTCEKGSQLRPHIVWFGEPVPMIQRAAYISSQADIYLVVGTSLNVYPAAGLLQYAPSTSPIYVVDPNMPYLAEREQLHLIEATGTQGLPKVYDELVEKYA